MPCPPVRTDRTDRPARCPRSPARRRFAGWAPLAALLHLSGSAAAAPDGGALALAAPRSPAPAQPRIDPARPPQRGPSPLLIPGASGPVIGAWDGKEISALVLGAGGDRVERVRLARAPGWDQAELTVVSGPGGAPPPAAHEVVALVPGLPVGPVQGFGPPPGAMVVGEGHRLTTTAEGAWLLRVDEELGLVIELHPLDEDGLPERAAAQRQALGVGDPSRPPSVEWIGDLDGDALPDLVIELSPSTGGPRKRRLLTGAAAAEGELLGLVAEGEAGGC